MNPIFVDGWKCSKCRRVYTDKGIAGSCCFPLVCSCGAECQKPYTLCEKCLYEKRHSDYMGKDASLWDGVQMLTLYDDDRYFHDLDGALDHIAECEALDDDERVTQEMVEKYMVMLCERSWPREFCVADFFEDMLPEDCDTLPKGAAEIERAVNNWASAANWCSWCQGNKRLLLAEDGR